MLSVKSTLNASALLMLLAFTPLMAEAKDFKVRLKERSTNISLGNTIVRNLENIPDGLPGRLKLRLKWHATSPRKTFNRLRIRLFHGNRLLLSSSCYSIHANAFPKCRIELRVATEEAAKAGVWKLQITNNSKYEVRGFDVESGIDKKVPRFESVFTATCPGPVKLDMEGTTLTLRNGDSQMRKLFRVGRSRGVLRIRAKWHTRNKVRSFERLRIELLKPRGEVAKSGEFYSFHARGKSPRMDMTYRVNRADAKLPGTWRLRITNRSGKEIHGFNIERESAETDPSVPSFRSTFSSSCR